MKTAFTFALVTLAAISGANAFVPNQPSSFLTKTSSTELFTVLSYKGKKKDFKAGSPIKNACANLGVKPKYSCKKGDCASCTISVAGTRIKACVGKVPPEPRLKSLQEKGLEIKG